MTKLHAIVAAAALLASASSAFAQQQGQTAPAGEQPPIPALGCEFKNFNSCAPDGTCKAGAEVEGLVVPLKVTIDFENHVLSAIDETGYPRTDKFDSVVNSGSQLMLNGVDGAFAWQLLIHDHTEGASIAFSTADSILTGFGTCAKR